MFSQETASRVEKYATLGLSRRDIALTLEIPAEDVKLYSAQIRRGSAKRRLEILATQHKLLRSASDKIAVRMAIHLGKVVLRKGEQKQQSEGKIPIQMVLFDDV
jgi:hypothetical protein